MECLGTERMTREMKDNEEVMASYTKPFLLEAHGNVDQITHVIERNIYN